MPTHRSRRLSALRSRTALAALAVAVLTAVASCSGTGDPQPSASPSLDEPTISKPVGLPEFSIEEEPLWSSEQLPVKPTSISFHRDLAVVIGGKPDDSFSWPTVVEAETGKKLWSLPDMARIPKLGATFMASDGMSVAGESGDEVLMVGYYSPDCLTEPCPPEGRQSPETGVAGLDLRTGKLRWHHPVIESADEEADAETVDVRRDQAIRIVGGPDGGPLVVVGSVMGLNGEQYDDPDKFRTIALDPASGEERWTVKRVVARMVSGDTVIGLTPPTGPDNTLNHGAGGPVALDLDTGKEIWNLTEDFPEVQLAGISQQQLMFTPQREAFEPGPRLVDLRDGSMIAKLGTVLPAAIMDQQSGLVSYRTQDHLERLYTRLPNEQQASLTGTEVPSDLGLSLAYDGYLLLSDSDDRTTVIDRSGTTVGKPISGRPMAVSDDYLVVQEGIGEDSRFAVHARG